jgi:hypothetical protein
MPTPLKRAGGPLEDVAPQDGWRPAEAWRGAASRGSGCRHAPSPSGILGLRQTQGHIRNHQGVTRGDAWSDCPAEIWRAMIVSVVLLGSIKTLLRPSQCRQVRSSCGSGLLACTPPCAQPPHLQRCDLDLAVKKITTGAIGALGRAKIPIIGNRRWIAHRG